MMQQLIIKGKSISFNDIQKGNFDTSHYDKYSQDAIHFCHEWLNGIETFTITTSGSTGKPKLIQLTRKQMQASASSTGKALGLQEGDHAFCCLNTNYIAGMMMLVRAMEIGMDITVEEPSGNPLEQFSVQDRFDFLSMVPMQVQATLQSDKLTSIMDNSKALIIGGAPASLELEELIKHKLQHIAVYATYGMTETVSHIALRQINGSTPSAAYKTLDGVELGQDDRGCLTIKAPMSNDELLFTNDLVELISADQFIWLGRYDNVINSGGVKVQAEKVEKAIESYLIEVGDSTPFFVAGIPDTRLGEKVVIFAEQQFPALDKKMLTHLSEILKTYELPKEVILVDEFEKTETQKVSRRKTIELYIQQNSL
ncbi:AMP-binding protein [Limibacter armeniacum]|uniref:AMP-binding protein n=1 Tax=Limibacter armeniacum TaxID=466084 RepID=UPI002FE5ADD8